MDGVDVLFVGPTDLSVSLKGKPVPFNDPVLVAARKKVVKAAHAHGKAAGILLMVPDQLGTVLKEGFTFIAAGWVCSLEHCCWLPPLSSPVFPHEVFFVPTLLSLPSSLARPLGAATISLPSRLASQASRTGPFQSDLSLSFPFSS